eukprot:gene4290-4710_t
MRGFYWLLTLLTWLTYFTSHSHSSSFPWTSSSSSSSPHHQQHHEDKGFEPYAENGGTIIALAGQDYCLIASDSRLCDGYTIRSREMTKVFEVSPGIFFAAAGCWSDVVEVSQKLTYACQNYHWETGHSPTTSSVAHLLANILFERRLFPFFSFSILTGLDEEGHGAVYKYDAVGSYERVLACCAGKAEEMIQPFLDEVSGMDEDNDLWTLQDDGHAFQSHRVALDLTREQACDLTLRACRAAAERQITLGDGIEISLLSRAAGSGGGGGGGNNNRHHPRGVRVNKLRFALPQH